ncbi:MAG: esterase [Bacteroidaceae bacterium]|nr:esterase [Bacteroidaceae bacterium]
MKVRRHLLAFLLLGIGSLASSAREYTRDSLKVDGQYRVFRLYRPEGLAQDAPLLFVLHGYSSPGEVDDLACRAADRHKFAVCIPIGLKDPTGKHSWNVGYPMQEGWKVDDVKSMCRMARYVQKKYHLSARNTFLSGMSNGGEMCYLLAYSDQKVFKAFGSLAGLTMQWLYKERRIPRPVPFLEIHGTSDTTSMWEGDPENTGGWNPYIAVPMAVHAVAAADRCEVEECDTVVYEQTRKHRPIIRHKYLRGDQELRSGSTR